MLVRRARVADFHALSVLYGFRQRKGNVDTSRVILLVYVNAASAINNCCTAVVVVVSSLKDLFPPKTKKVKTKGCNRSVSFRPF